MISLLTNTRFDFMKRRKLAVRVSVVLIVISLVSLVFRGMNFGIDFTGGTLIEVEYEQAVLLDDVRRVLGEAEFSDTKVQYFGTGKSLLLRVPLRAETARAEISSQIIAALEGLGELEIRRVEYVGPQVGEELREDGGLALLYALLGILIYVAFRFEYRFAFGAVIALAHDVLLTIGFFSITGIESDLTVLAALLAVVGYSLNDTIVVYDRVRENLVASRRLETTRIINQSISQTLARTIVTSLTTLLVLIALLVFGGSVIQGFTIAMIVGVIVGTYSSVYIAGSCLVTFGITQQDMAPVKKEGAEFRGS